MKDVPDSASDSDENLDSFQGLSSASIYLGEGAILYLQIMKTLGIMFLILTIINLPVYMIFSRAKKNSEVNIFDIQSVTDNFCLGNIDYFKPLCISSHVNYDKAKELYPNLSPLKTKTFLDLGESKNILQYKCNNEGDYIFEIKTFGFVQLIDYEYDGFTNATERCEIINGKEYKRNPILNEKSY